MKIVQKLVKIVAIFFVLLLPITSTASAFAATSSGAGGLDRTFGTEGRVLTQFGAYNDAANAIVLQPDGKIVAVGTRGIMFALVRYNNDGSLDSTFGTGGKRSTDFFPDQNGTESGNAAVIQPDGKIVVAGTAYDGSNNNIAVARYNSDGSLDSSFNGDGKITTDFGSSVSGNAIVLQSDGQIVVVGDAMNSSDGTTDVALARYETDGSPDQNFGTNGQVTTHFSTSADTANAVTIQPDGKIIVAGHVGRNSGNDEPDFALMRYNSDGLLDNSFGTNGFVRTAIWANGGSRPAWVKAVILQPDGKILVAGTADTYTDWDFVLVRYTSSGVLDTTFGSNGKVITNLGNRDQGNAIALQPDGKILVAGYRHDYQSPTPHSYFAMVRYNSNGSADTLFGDYGRVNSYFLTPASNIYDLAFANAIAIQPNGKIILAGSNTYTGKDSSFALTRYDVSPLTASYPSKASQDGWILESAENSTAGGSLNTSDATFRVGDEASNRQYRSILSFDTSSLPDDAYIQKAVLKIKQSGVPIGSNPFNILGTLWLDAQSSHFGNGPMLELADFNAEVSFPNPKGSFDKTPVNGWYTSTLPATWGINKYGTTQIRLYFGNGDNNDNAADYMKFFSGNATTATDRPQFVISYYVP